MRYALSSPPPTSRLHTLHRALARLLTCAFTLCALTLSLAAHATPLPSTLDTAEVSFDQLVKQGNKKFEAKDYEGALELFEEAYVIKPTANLLYNIARMYENLGQFQDAIDHYKKFLVAPDIEIQIRQDALDRIKTLDEVLKLTGGPTTDTGSTSGVTTPTTTPHTGGLIDLNTADAKTLETLPGIGPSKSAAIIQYREQNGPFPTVDALTNVKGIGVKTVAKFRDKVTVSP
jgi:comEA protein